MPADYRAALEGIPFPASKVQILVYAGEHGAGDDTMGKLQALPVRQYDNIEEIGARLEEAQDVSSHI